jgi:hypothetical protein
VNVGADLKMIAHRRVAAVVLVFSSVLGSPVWSREADPLSSKLPDGDGKQIVLETCAGACHSSDRIFNARKTPAEWKKTVDQMISNGAQLFPEEVETVTKYLSSHFTVEGSAGAKK